MKRYVCVFTLLLFAVMVFVPPVPVGAQGDQTAADLVVLQTVTTESEDVAQLRVFVTLRDQQGKPVLNNNVQLANQGTMTINGEHVQATVAPASDPIKIALVIDGSGSMNLRDSQGKPLIDQVREAAAHMIDVAPANAEFAIFSFADHMQRQNDGFLRRRDQAELAKDAIRTFKINRPNTGDTCLYDAASQAIDALLGSKPAPSERLSVILFTDGKDREAGGAACASTIGAPELIRKALGSEANPIPIYTIGVCSNDRAPAEDIAKACNNVNSADLTTLAKETRAFPTIDRRDKLNQLFEQIMQGLSNQWVVQADVCPTAGHNVALLEVGYDQTTLSKAVPFNATRTCLQPPTFAIAAQVYAPATDTYSVTMALGSHERIKQMTVGVFDYEEGGSQIGSPLTFDDPSDRLTFALPSTGMAAGKEYYVRVTAKGRDDQPIHGDKGNPVVAINKFTYTPSLDFQIKAVEPDWNAEQLVIDLRIIGAGGRTLTFGGELRDPETGQSEPLAATTPENSKLRVAMPRMVREARAARTYNVTLGFDNGSGMATRTYSREIAPPTRQEPGLLSGARLIGLLAVLVIGAIGAAALIWRRTRAANIPKPYSEMTMIRPSQPPTASKPPVASKPPAVPAPNTTSQPSLALRVAPTTGATEVHASESHTALATVMARRLRLRIVQTPAPGIVLEQTVVSFPFVIGRMQGDLMLPHDPKVSSRHVQIDEAEGGFGITDLGSRNGTWIEGRRLAHNEPQIFEQPIMVRLGPSTEIEFVP